MELVLNFAWLALALTMVTFWLHHSAPARAGRGMQLVAIAALLLILFPVISVSDDLAAAQNPAETDATIRRIHQADGAPVHFPAVALHASAMEDFSFPDSGLTERIGDQQQSPAQPAIFARPVNRPPPAV